MRGSSAALRLDLCGRRFLMLFCHISPPFDYLFGASPLGLARALGEQCCQLVRRCQPEERSVELAGMVEGVLQLGDALVVGEHPDHEREGAAAGLLAACLPVGLVLGALAEERWNALTAAVDLDEVDVLVCVVRGHDVEIGAKRLVGPRRRAEGAPARRFVVDS